MKYASRAVTIIVLLVLAATGVNGLKAQPASYMEGGMMLLRTKKAGLYDHNWIPGFSIGVAGLEFTVYGGKVPMKEFPDSSKASVNTGFWNIGYIWRSAPRENLKRFHITMGCGVGGYGIKGTNGFHGNVRPGVQINLTRSISLSASIYAGYNFFLDTDTTSFVTNGYLSTQKWFMHPSITLRFNTNPIAVKGDYYDKTAYWGGGNVTSESVTREGDYIVTRRSSQYLPAGEYITDAIVTSTNYINLYPKMLVGTMHNYKGNSLALGGGVAVRAGLLALDVEYLQGKIGFHQSKVGSHHDQWNMRRTSVGIGMNWFNIPFPLKGPSLVRFIFGARLGKLTLDSNRPDLIAGEPNPEEQFRQNFWSPFFAFEFGTLGIHMEFFNQKQNGYASGLVLGATYLLPLTK